MSDEEMREAMLAFIDEIMIVHCGERARDLQRRIHEFYINNDVPEDKNVLAQSGFCELLALLAHCP